MVNMASYPEHHLFANINKADLESDSCTISLSDALSLLMPQPKMLVA